MLLLSENGSRDKLFGSNPHSKGEDFSQSSINFLDNSEANIITINEIIMMNEVIIIIVIIVYLVLSLAEAVISKDISRIPKLVVMLTVFVVKIIPNRYHSRSYRLLLLSTLQVALSLAALSVHHSWRYSIWSFVFHQHLITYLFVA